MFLNHTSLVADLIVTRHPALALYLAKFYGGSVGDQNEQGGIPILNHVEDPSDLDGKNVVGVLPLHLAARCRQVIEIPLDIPLEYRGKELSIEEIFEFAQLPVSYVVRKLEY